MKSKRPSLFNGYWHDMEGNKIRRIWRKEYGELYRLHRLCVEYEKQDVAGGGGVDSSVHGLPLSERNPFHEEGGLAR